MAASRPDVSALRATLEASVAARDAVDPDSAPVEELVNASTAMAERFHRGAFLLVVGGPAVSSDVDHLAVEFVHPVTAGARAIGAFAAVADDARGAVDAVRSLGRDGDVCLAIAERSDDPVLSSALAAARHYGLTGVALVNSRAASAPTVAPDHLVVAGPGAKESLVVAYHVLWELVQVALASQPVAA